MKDVLCLIPARGGSKGIPRKNLADLGGRPLVAHAIAAARGCPLITRVVVSTDDEEIASVARAWGAEVPFLRPAEIAGDRALIGDAVNFTLDRLRRDEGYDPDILVEMYPTQPFRTAELVREVVSLVGDGGGLMHAMTVEEIEVGPGTFLYLDRDRIIPAGPVGKRIYRAIGSVLAHLRKYPREFRTLEDFMRDDLRRWEGSGYVIVRDPAMLIDIDTPDDLALARKMIEKGLWTCT